MQVKNEIQTGLPAEIKIIPTWAWTLALTGFASAQIFFNLVLARQADAPPAWGRVLMGLGAGIGVAFYLLFLGYISRDARRRGMSSLLWTLVAIFIPNGLGIIVYFLLRQPLRSTCPQCAEAVQVGFHFCPRCSCKLRPSCPQCQHVVSGNDVYCPYCGQSLRDQAVPDYAASPGSH